MPFTMSVGEDAERIDLRDDQGGLDPSVRNGTVAGFTAQERAGYTEMIAAQ